MKRETRLAVFEKLSGRCAYCGCEVTAKSFQVDHVHPKVSGGTDDMDNLLPSCRPCNNYKLFFTLEEFRRMVGDQINLLRRNATNFRHAERFGLVKATVPESIVFYFERASGEQGRQS
jgi:predicted restriction endonuclease